MQLTAARGPTGVHGEFVKMCTATEHDCFQPTSQSPSHIKVREHQDAPDAASPVLRSCSGKHGHSTFLDSCPPPATRGASSACCACPRFPLGTIRTDGLDCVSESFHAFAGILFSQYAIQTRPFIKASTFHVSRHPFHVSDEHHQSPLHKMNLAVRFQLLPSTSVRVVVALLLWDSARERFGGNPFGITSGFL